MRYRDDRYRGKYLVLASRETGQLIACFGFVSRFSEWRTVGHNHGIRAEHGALSKTFYTIPASCGFFKGHATYEILRAFTRCGKLFDSDCNYSIVDAYLIEERAPSRGA
jgi:hypothetical protein